MNGPPEFFISAICPASHQPYKRVVLAFYVIALTYSHALDYAHALYVIIMCKMKKIDGNFEHEAAKEKNRNSPI
ncbi:hypothetical protein BX070DRAFT_220762 [Coemansia spiralis]|nr:hypothetical protein BX070DRAFT_220762 [Coemansia spiralis]